MKLDYQSKKWQKETDNFRRFKKDIKGDYLKNLRFVLNEFEKTGCTGYLRLFCLLSGTYQELAEYYYLDEAGCPSIDIFNAAYLSGLAGIVAKTLFENGVRTGSETLDRICTNSVAEKYEPSLFQLISVGETDSPYLSIAENDVIMLIYRQKYEQARVLVEALPDAPDESRELYYNHSEFLKHIYIAILDKDEKAFNDELAKRIRKYRRNMAGYSPIIDYTSVALIKIAQQAGLNCTVDVIEVPHLFFDDSLKIDKTAVALPYLDKFESETQ